MNSSWLFSQSVPVVGQLTSEANIQVRSLDKELWIMACHPPASASQGTDYRCLPLRLACWCFCGYSTLEVKRKGCGLRQA